MEYSYWNIVLNKIKNKKIDKNIYNPLKNRLNKIDYSNYNHKLIKSTNKFNINIENEYLNKKYNNYFNNKINKLDIYLLENKSLLHIYYDSNKYKQINIIIDKLSKCYKLLSLYFNNKNKNNIYIYLTPFKKKITGKILKKDNINSGYTNILSKDITIYRIEELEKVFIHELIHSFNIDNHLNPIIINNMNNNIYININESITELLADIIYYIYLHLEYKKDLNEIINLEFKFSINQSLKYLHHFEYNNFNEFLYNNNKLKINDNTNYIEYVIIKTALLFNIDKFITIFFNNNLLHIDYELCKKFIIDSLYNKDFIKLINNNYNNHTFINTNKMILHELIKI